MTSPTSTRPRAVAFGLVKVAPAGLGRVVASFFSAPGSGSPSPVEVAPAGLGLGRVVAFFSPALDSLTRSCILPPPAFCGVNLQQTVKDCPFSALALFLRPRWLRFVWIDNYLSLFLSWFFDFDCFDERFLILYYYWKLTSVFWRIFIFVNYLLSPEFFDAWQFDAFSLKSSLVFC